MAETAKAVTEVTEAIKGTDDAEEKTSESGYRTSDYIFLGVFCVLGILGVVSILSRPKPNR